MTPEDWEAVMEEFGFDGSEHLSKTQLTLAVENSDEIDGIDRNEAATHIKTALEAELIVPKRPTDNPMAFEAAI
jgi:protein-tyrosine-phosphatase